MAIAALASPAPAPAEFSTGLWGDEYSSSSSEVRDEWFDKTLRARAGLVRLDLHWRDAVSRPPATPSDPGDPAYDFSLLDGAVRDATERGLKVMITIYDAPNFAEGPGRPPSAPEGTWMPDPAALADFGHAVSTRYSGGYQDLPRVRYFEVWNEPNLPVYLTPQWSGDAPASPDHFREMLNAFHGAVKAVDRRAVVIAGGLAPYGDDLRGDRLRPLRFLRRLFCLETKLDRAPECPAKPRFDILAHHPINTSGGPERSAIHPDDASTPDFGSVRRTLRAAEHAGTVAGPNHHDLWATEIWWETDPPDPTGFTGLRKHARWIQQTLFILWSQGAKLVVNFPIRDYPYTPDDPFPLQSGIFFHDGRPKPAFTAFRFPFVTERKTPRKLEAWGKAPVTGRLRIERRTKRGWTRLKELKVTRGKVFAGGLTFRGPAKLRARIGSEKSLIWSQRR